MVLSVVRGVAGTTVEKWRETLSITKMTLNSSQCTKCLLISSFCIFPEQHKDVHSSLPGTLAQGISRGEGGGGGGGGGDMEKGERQG